MPELPEVETVCQGLLPLLTQKTVLHVDLIQPQLRWPVNPQLNHHLCGQQFVTLTRRGKYIIFHLSTGYLLGHLGMSGSFRVVDNGTPLKKHDHICFSLNNHRQLRYHDPRRFGSIHWCAESPLSHPLLQNLGPEPLSDAFTPITLYNALQKTKRPIKTSIMDHRLVVGVGNIYATEALFKSQIHPNRPACSLSITEATLLHQQIQSLLQVAISRGGTTLKDFVNADDKPGYFQQTLLAYGRNNQPCTACHTPLSSMQIGQRTTVFCTQCQH